MKISDVIKILVEEIALRGDAQIVQREAESPAVWEIVKDCKVYKTPFNAPEGAAYIEFK
jgi:hypothetical protein